MKWLLSLVLVLLVVGTLRVVGCGDEGCAEPVADPSGLWTFAVDPVEDTCAPPPLPSKPDIRLGIVRKGEGNELATTCPSGNTQGLWS
jgi:hypothetical protein